MSLKVLFVLSAHSVLLLLAAEQKPAVTGSKLCTKSVDDRTVWYLCSSDLRVYPPQIVKMRYWDAKNHMNICHSSTKGWWVYCKNNARILHQVLPINTTSKKIKRKLCDDFGKYFFCDDLKDFDVPIVVLDAYIKAKNNWPICYENEGIWTVCNTKEVIIKSNITESIL